MLYICCIFLLFYFTAADAKLKKIYDDDLNYLAICVFKLIGQPIETLIETIAASCARRLNVPVAVS